MNMKKINLTLKQAVSRLIPITILAVGLLLLQMASLLAQTTGPGTGQERKSKPKELQKDPKPESQAPTGPKMDPNRPPEAISIQGKVEKMEEHLARPLEMQAPEGIKQMPVDPTRAASPQQGTGEQQHSGAPSTESHLHLVLRISDTGDTEVITATEVPGEAIIPDEPIGDFIYEVTRNGQPVAVQALSDPFEMRSFPGPADPSRVGHHIERAKTATLVVKVPKTSLASVNLDKLEVRLYKMKADTPIEKINLESVAKLKQNNLLEMRLDIPGSKIAPQILQMGRKMAPQ
jgi:hypothetical protein